MGPIERELRDRCERFPSELTQAQWSLTRPAWALLTSCWVNLLPEKRGDSYTDCEDAWSEAIEAAEALGL